jgi:hypothetical protein
VQCFHGFDIKAAIARYVERLAASIGFGFGFAGQFHHAFAGDQFHDFRGAGVEHQLGRQKHAHALAGAIGQDDGVRHTLAIKIHIALFDYGYVIELLAHEKAPMDKTGCKRLKLLLQYFRQNGFDNETEHAKTQHKKQDKGAELARI